MKKAKGVIYQRPSESKGWDTCQDRLCFYWNSSVINVSCVCDGLGSCKYSRLGAETVTKAVAKYVLKRCKTYLPKDPKNFVDDLMNMILSDIKGIAKEKGISEGEMATTMLLAVEYQDLIYFLQVGDGYIVVADADEHQQILFNPDDNDPTEDSEYSTATHTIFDYSKSLRYTCLEASDIKAYFLMSDGVQKMSSNLPGSRRSLIRKMNFYQGNWRIGSNVINLEDIERFSPLSVEANKAMGIPFPKYLIVSDFEQLLCEEMLKSNPDLLYTLTHNGGDDCTIIGKKTGIVKKDEINILI